MTIDFQAIDAVFFDLDGTLLGLSDTDFERIYMGLISKRFEDLLEPEFFMKALWKGTEEMMKHDDPDNLVLQSFFDTFTTITGIDQQETYDRFDAFYNNEFEELGKANQAVPEGRQLIDLLTNNGIKVVLATNPVFPEIATRKRCQWTGLDFDEFLYVSHAENSYACKPSRSYYERLLEIAGVEANRTLMVGNDYLFDIGAKMYGFKTWMIDRFQSNLEYKEKFVPDHVGSLNLLLDKFSN